MRSSGFELTRKQSVALVVLIVLSVAWIFFIFSNSLKNADVSSDQSGRIVDFVIDNVLHTPDEYRSVAFVDKVTNFVRKMAHFTEFAILSSLLFFTFYILRHKKTECFAFSLIFTLFVAVTDELLQIFSDGRACRFTDILIDCSGGICMCSLICLILYFADCANKRCIR